MLIDLQLHSTYSDGYLAPAALAEFIAGRGVKIASLTDHNTVGGLAEFKLACAKHKIKAINGLELYAKLNGRKFNLLWYNFDQTSPALHQLLRQSQIRRRRQIRLALIKLKKYGFKLEPDKLLDKFSRYIPVNRLIDQICLIVRNKDLIAKKIGSSSPAQGDIIKTLFGPRGIAKMSNCRIAFEHILKLRRRIGGQLILNHPGKHNQLDEKLIAALKKVGLDGLEMISPHHPINAAMFIQRLAGRYKLIATGGSDFHLSETGQAKLKNCYDYFRVEAKHLSGINKIIG
ncbi:MAG: PHP domain-containing protein [bacterium]|nr:PHP domain-containing protein [bacterium]